jgi:hypothetical protein
MWKRAWRSSQRVTVGCLWVGVIVGNDVDVEIGRGLVIDGFEEGQPLLVAMARRQAGDQLALEKLSAANRVKVPCRT